MHAVVSLPTLQDLQAHVLQTLCQDDRLDPAQTPLHQAIMTRSRRCCGLYFMVQGPRLVKAYAIWASEENRILFYDAGNQRFAETRLSESPEPPRAAA